MINRFAIDPKTCAALDEMKRNRLIREAAPEMYEALKKIVTELEQCNGGRGPRLSGSLRTLEIARPALAKAEGK